MIKRLIIGIAVSTSVVAATVLGAHAQVDGKRLAHITLALNNPFVSAVAGAIEETSTQHGMTAQVFSGPFDAALQSRQIDDAIAQNYDALLVFPADPNALLPALTRAKAAGIPVFLVNSTIAEGHDDLFVSVIGTDQVEMGRIAAQQAAAAVAGREDAKVAVIAGSLSESTPQKRLAGFEQAIGENPNMKIVAVEDARWDMARSEQIAGQLFARFQASGGLDVVFGMADYMAFAVIQAAKSAGVPLGTGKGELTVVSSDCHNLGINAILAGEQYSTIDSSPIRIGRSSVEAVVQHFGGQQLKKVDNLPIGPITKENAEGFLNDCTF
ncbi:ribose ABC transporter substrate-binding protein [Mesorhizobium sp. L-8-10]|uniref:sugar ABC transporter substrate-binding protein n=1 Tax=Mesorhizobium sp. L-8-10 TaxID=2744523 RepID=UPI0019283DAF|nr:sugar ABC transporter substrate-binding protein [Mesorhizobium sp. L-8-10]BCH29371.1 ribose ABC transporter substrate-binding protein [Mesorhizobium sp. L-8-10]